MKHMKFLQLFLLLAASQQLLAQVSKAPIRL